MPSERLGEDAETRTLSESRDLNRSTSHHQLAVRRLDEAGWILLADRLIRGICHDLNGRSGSISSVAHLLDLGEVPTSIIAILEQESRRLEEDVRLLRLLPDDAEEPQMLAPGEILPSLASMIPLQRGLEGVRVRVDIPPSAPAIYMDRTVFVRALLLLLSAAAEEAERSGASTVDVTSSDQKGVLRIHPARIGRPDGPGSAPANGKGDLPVHMEARVQEVLTEVGGGLSQHRGGREPSAWEIRLPFTS